MTYEKPRLRVFGPLRSLTRVLLQDDGCVPGVTADDPCRS